MPCECLLITGCMAWIACESSFFKLVVFHEPRHHAREAAQFFNNNVISCFLVVTDKLHVISSAGLFCGLWLLWNTVQTCFLNFWPSLEHLWSEIRKIDQKKQKQKIAKVWHRRTLLVWWYTFYDFQSRALLFDIGLFSELYIGSRAASMDVGVSCDYLGSRAVVISRESLPPEYSRNTPKKWACSRVI